MPRQPGVIPLKPSGPRKRVLIVNCYFPEIREPVRLTHEVPQPLAPVFLAGMFHPDRCDVRIYNEVASGFVELYEPDLLDWPDLIVFSGLTTTLDRMLHISAYARTRNPAVITAAGGIAIRAFRQYVRGFFDYICTGDVEEIRDVILDAFGPEYVSPEFTPRYDLAGYMEGRIGYVESSRNCNFRCNFCSLTADGHRYLRQPVDALRQQIVALGYRDLLFFADNQFHPQDREFFAERMALLRELRAAGYFKYWSAFVTDTFFWNDEEVAMAREAGCFSLFVGVESFDEIWLRSMNKAQNVRHSQLDLIEKCCDAGILFQYGLVFDPSERSVGDMHRELSIICDTPTIPAPNFIFMAIPLPGTPFLHDRIARGMLLPNTHVRDLEGSTISMQTVDPIEIVADFVRTGKHFRGYARRLVSHQARFLWRYRRQFNAWQSLASSLCVASILSPTMISNPRYAFRRRSPRTHISTTERLDVCYTPHHRVDARFESYFAPTQVTDAGGQLNEALADDLLATRFRQRHQVS